MRCSQCHTANSDQARFCMSCGVPLTHVSVAPRTPTASIDFQRLGPGDLVTGGATIILFISLFLPWYRFGMAGSSITISAMATGAGGWQLVSFLTAPELLDAHRLNSPYLAPMLVGTRSLRSEGGQ